MLKRILVVGLLGSALVFAQRGGGGRGERGDIAPRLDFGGTRLDRMADAVKLNKDQKKQIKATMDEAQKEAIPLHDQINKSRLAIAEAIAAAKPQPEIDAAVRSEAELEAQMVSLELHAFAKAVALLETDQKQRGVPTIFAMVRGAFMGKNWNTD
jgi:Spy/CpxP family protein refolding chaperone